MKLRIAITCLSACLLPAPALRAQDSPRVACYDLTVRIDVPERRVTVGGSFDVNFLGSDSIALVLWRHARIDTMRCDAMKRPTVSIRSPPHPPGSFPTDAP